MSRPVADAGLSFLAGVIFAVGLVVGGMTQPGKVVAFLDVFGDWDPSLAFVLGGAVVAHTLGYAVQRRWSAPLGGGRWMVPRRTDVDARLLVGAALFGAGWGLVGYCPGPALVSIPVASADILWFAAAMVCGMVLHRLYDRWRVGRMIAVARA